MPGDDVAEAPLECNDQSLDCGENATTATITAILPRGAKGNAFTVELSNGERLSLRSETVATHRLSVGDTVDSAAITAWQRDNSARLAVEAGLNFISFRPRSTKEVADHLRKKSLDTGSPRPCYWPLARARVFRRRGICPFLGGESRHASAQRQKGARLGTAAKGRCRRHHRRRAGAVRR